MADDTEIPVKAVDELTELDLIDPQEFFLGDEVEIRVRGLRADVYVLPIALQVACEMWPAYFRQAGVPPNYPPARTTTGMVEGALAQIGEQLPGEEVKLFNRWTRALGEVPPPAGDDPRDALDVDVVDPRRGGDPIVDELRDLRIAALAHRDEAAAEGRDDLGQFYDGQASGLDLAIGVQGGHDGDD